MLNIKISFVIFSSHSYYFNFSYFILSTNISLPVSIVLWSIYGIFISLCQFHIYILRHKPFYIANGLNPPSMVQLDSHEK